MESIPVEILVAVEVLALGLGIVSDRILLRRLGHDRLANAKSEADRLRSDQLREIAEEKKERVAKLERELVEKLAASFDGVERVYAHRRDAICLNILRSNVKYGMNKEDLFVLLRKQGRLGDYLGPGVRCAGEPHTPYAYKRP